MTTVWRNLAWKEWREHQWKLASLTSIVLATTVYIHVSEGINALGPITAILYAIVLPGAVFVAMGVAAGERSAGTMEFVRTLPIARSRIAAAKLLIGAVTCALPPVICVAVALGLRQLTFGAGWSGPAPPANAGQLMPCQFLSVCALASGVAVSVFLWSAAAGIRQPTEMRAGFAAVLLLIGWLVFFQIAGVSIAIAWNDVSWQYMVGSLIALTPGAGLLLLSFDVPRWLVVLPQMLSASAAVAWVLTHYGWLTSAENRSPRPADSVGTHPPARRPWNFPTPLRALVWKQVRESLVLALAGMATMIGVTFTIDVYTLVQQRAWLRVFEAAEMLTTVTILLGIPLALIAGIGTFVPELRPKLWSFWRSRPITAEQWFISKFLIGGMMLVIGLQAPVCWLRVSAGLPVMGCIVTGAGVHLLTFAVAAAVGCLVRQEIYAGILSLGVVVGIALAIDDVPWFSEAFRALTTGRATSLAAYLPCLAAILAASAVAVAIAWLSVKFDWGRS